MVHNLMWLAGSSIDDVQQRLQQFLENDVWAILLNPVFDWDFGTASSKPHSKEPLPTANIIGKMSMHSQKLLLMLAC